MVDKSLSGSIAEVVTLGVSGKSIERTGIETPKRTKYKFKKKARKVRV